MFSVFDQDLVWSKWMMAGISTVGIYFFIKYYKQFRKDIFYIFLSSVLFGQIFSSFVSLDTTSTIRIILFQGAVTFTYPFIRKYTDVYGFKHIFNAYLVSFYAVFLFLIWQIIYQHLFGKLTGGIWPVPGYPTRYGSTFWDVNHFGAYLSSMIFMFLGCFFAFKKQKNRRYYLIGAVLSFIALTFTDSRSASLGFISGSLLFWGFAFKERIYEKLNIKNKYHKYFIDNSWLWGSLIFTVGFMFVMWFLQNAINQAFFYRSTSFFSHLYLLKAGMSLAISNFSSGIGANAFNAYFKQSDWSSAYYYIDQAALNYKLPLHNLWLEVFVETGIISFVLFVLMWIVGIGFLLKLFRKKNDFLALGFASAIVSFLVGGLFYSYKAEFFWIFIIVAFVYGSKDLDDNVIVEKFKDAKYIFYYIFENDYRFRKSFMVSLSILSFLSLMVYIFNPILVSEIKEYYFRLNYSIVQDPFLYFINLMRYIFGNYSFSGRIITTIFFVGIFVLLIGIFAKFVKFYKATILSAIMMNIFSIFTPSTYVSSFYIKIYFMTIVLYFVVSLIFRNVKKRKIDYRILADLLLLFSVVAHVSIYQSMTVRSYDKDLSFIVELAANRSVLNNSTIWIEDEKGRDILKYYSDHIESVDRLNLAIRSEQIKTLDELDQINFDEKNVFVVSGLNKYRLEGAINYSDIIKHKNYYIIIAEPVGMAVLDFQ
ncbi:MAG: O-antigen ligase family protein [Candidatus Woesearchaeota archaeon]